MENKDIDFVARHYRRGLFDTGKAWKALGIRRSGLLRRWQIAASVAVIAVAGAVSAVVIITRPEVPQMPQQDVRQTAPTTEQPSSVKADESIVIDFDNATLTEIVSRIETEYGVNVEGVPDIASDIRLTLHFEGNVDDLVDTINAMLDTEMTVESK